MFCSLTFHVLRGPCGVLLVSGGGSTVAALRLRSVTRPVPHRLDLGLAILLRCGGLSVSLGAAGRRWGSGGGGGEQDWW